MSLRNILNWQFVRGVGEYQILTRASYLMLAVVPMLVGVWPSVRVIINSHNRVLEQTTKRLATFVDSLRQETNVVVGVVQRATDPLTDVNDERVRSLNKAIADLTANITSLSTEIEAALDNLRRQGTLSPLLPRSWALAFFAALSVALGHAIYQARAPNIVRKNTLLEYIRQQRDAFHENAITEYDFQNALIALRENWWRSHLPPIPQDCDTPATAEEYRNYFMFKSLIRSQLLTALNAVIACSPISDDNTAVLLTPAERDTASQLRAAIYGHLYRYDIQILQDDMEEHAKDVSNMGTHDRGKAFSDSIFSMGTSDHPTDNSPGRVQVIDEMAHLEYTKAASQGTPALLLALLLYSIGGIIIAWIICDQVIAVMKAAGWIRAVM
jgi:hypothetical protein